MDQFELYFQRADLDQDGHVSGSEAISFFKGSGLPKQVLAQIWTFVDEKRRGHLGREEFYNCLKLVTVAQSKRDLTPDIVKAALYGPASAKIPPPHINLEEIKLEGSPTTSLSSKEISKKELRVDAYREIGRWFCDAGIPFSAASYDSFRVALEAVAQSGPGFKAPSMHQLRGPILTKEVEDTKILEMNDHKKEWATKGCSILIDGWHDSSVQKDIVNFLVNSPKGSVFVKSIDASEITHDAHALCSMLEEMVDEIGEENVVQVVTNHTPNYVRAGKLLESSRPHLYWTPCVAHCIDLMLEDIGKIPKIKDCLKDAMFANAFIYNHVGLINMLRRYTNQRDLHRPAATHSTTSFITLSEMHKQKNNLRNMVTSSEWNASKWAKESGGMKVTSIFLQERFWRNIVYALKLTGPLVKVLRVVDGNKKFVMGYIYESMKAAKDAIAASFNHEKEEYLKVFQIIDKRWECQLHRPLQVAGFFLNPGMYYDNEEKAKSGEIMRGVIDCIGRLIHDENTQDIISMQLKLYQHAVGLFGNPMAKRQRKTRSSVDWWSTFGGDAPELQKFAIRVLSLTCSAMGCERNWGVFQHLHTKRRNQLAQKRLNNLVYIKFNRALKCRYQRKDTTDSLLSTEIDESSEWVTGIMDDENEGKSEVVFEEDGLTWHVVEKASMTSEPPYSTRSNTPTESKEKGVTHSNTPTPKVSSRGVHELINEDDTDDEEMEDETDLSEDDE